MPVDCPSPELFRRELTNAKGKLVVVDFYATWCGPCKQIAPIYEKLSQQYQKEAHFLKVDVDQNREVAQQAGITAMPSFGFYVNGQLLEVIRGADPRALEEKIKTLSAKHNKNAFVGGSGYSLSGPSNPSPSSSSANISSQADAARPTRRNPWADPSFFPGKSSSSTSSTSNASTTPTSAPTPKPTPPTSTASSVPVTNKQEAFTDVPSAVQQVVQNPVPSNSSLPAGLNVNQNFLSQLQDMGFEKIRSEKSLLLTKNVSVDAALAWLLEHQDDIDIDEPLQVVGSTTSSTVVSNDSDSNPMAIDESTLDEDERVLYDEFMKKNRAEALSKKASSSVSSSSTAAASSQVSGGRKLNEMTSEEKMEWLANRKKEVATKRETEAIQREKDTYKSTKGMSQALNDLKEQREEHERKLAIERRKKEDAEKNLHRRQLQAKLAEDKKRRVEEYNKQQEEIRRIREAKAKGGNA